MNSMVSVAMKAGTCSTVTSTPLTRPTTTPSARQHSTDAIGPRSRREEANATANTVADKPAVEPMERSSSRLTMTKVVPTASTPYTDASRSTENSAPPEPKKCGLM